jgi:hypothetical protein
MPVHRLLDEMPYEEMQGWFAYFESRPVEWRDDDRAYKLLQAQGVKEKAYKIFPTLEAIYKPRKKNEEDFDVAGLKTSVLFHKMLSAKGGDKLNL